MELKAESENNEEEWTEVWDKVLVLANELMEIVPSEKNENSIN